MEEFKERQLDIERIRKRIEDIERLRQTLINNKEILKNSRNLPRPHRIALQDKIDKNKDLLDDESITFYGETLTIPRERKAIILDEAFKINATRDIYSKQVFYISPSEGPGFLDRYFNLCFSKEKNSQSMQKPYAFLYTCFENPSKIYRYDSIAEASAFEKGRTIITKKEKYEDISYDDIYTEYMNVLLIFGQEEADSIIAQYFDISYPDESYERIKENN